MEKVVGIIDMDGYQIGKTFFSKVLGTLQVGEDEVQSFFFDICVRWNDLSEKEKRTCSYVQRKIHRLPFGVPNGTEAHPIASLGKIVADFYNKVKKSSDSTIAYKGGHYERDLLNLLKIPSVNFESFNCPKAEALLSALVWMDKCSNHTVSNAYHHCGKFEVEAFGCWLVSQKV